MKRLIMDKHNCVMAATYPFKSHLAYKMSNFSRIRNVHFTKQATIVLVTLFLFFIHMSFFYLKECIGLHRIDLSNAGT